ncbi:MAG: GNAT family N-acetyltransferase [Rhodobacteraceae bacterium]|jgi:GNAT superfamily N-acetyltransferase|nr:GNAT family N-acetyltransferase [Paracoccaceae bacterium]
MSRHRAGETVTYTVTWLEMDARPARPMAPLPGNIGGTILRADDPPVWYFRALYDAVGRDYAWDDMHDEPEDKLKVMLHDPAVSMYTLMAAGWPHGFFLMDWRQEGRAEIANFGLVPQAIGRGLGAFLLDTAIQTGWERAGVRKLTVNTCTLDHPRALQRYQKHGFQPVAQQQRSRVLRRDLPHPPA